MRFFRPVPRLTLADPAQAAAIEELLHLAWADPPPGLSSELVESMTPVPGEVGAWLRGGFELYSASLDGVLVGIVRCAFPTGACVIDRLTVHPGQRRRGFGVYLAEHAVARARRAGVARAWSATAEPAAAAGRIWTGLGFRDGGRFRTSRHPEPLVLYELNL